MPQSFVKLFSCKCALNALAVFIEDRVRTGHSWCSRFRASVHPHKTDQTQDEEYRAKTTANKPRPQQ